MTSRRYKESIQWNWKTLRLRLTSSRLQAPRIHSMELKAFNDAGAKRCSRSPWIHSMELKDATRIESPSWIGESIQWNWKRSASRLIWLALRSWNPFNGIERHNNKPKTRRINSRGIHSMELKASSVARMHLGLSPWNPFNGIERLQSRGPPCRTPS